MSGAPPASRSGRHRDSPRVRRLARESGVDLDQVRRTGRHGRATPADVLKHAERPPAPARATLEPLTSQAQLTTVVEVDLTRVTQAAAAGAGPGEHVSASALVLVAAAVARALGDHPAVNGRLDHEDGAVTHPSAVGLGIVVDTESGQLVPVVANARDLSVDGLSRRITDLTARARSGRLTGEELAGATVTVVDTGGRGALFDTPALLPGQAAVVGVGAVVRRPAVVVDSSGEEQLAIRSMAHLTLTYDPRVVGGAEAARYMAAVKSVLEGWDAGASGGGDTQPERTDNGDGRSR